MHQTVDHENPTTSPYAVGRVTELIGHCARGESHLPSSVMTALTLLAIPGSRPLGADGPGGPPHETGTAGSVISREITDVRWAVLTHQLGGHLDSNAPGGSDESDQPHVRNASGGVDLRDAHDLPQVWAAQEIDLIEAADRVIAWAHHLQLGAIARLREAIGAHCDTQLTSAALHHGAFYDVDREADAATEDEVALVTGLPDHEAARRLRFAAAADGRGRVALARLHEGRTTLDRCLRILDATSECHTDDVNTITDRVLAELPDGSKPAHRLFIRRLRRQVVLHQPDPTTRHADALSRRTAFGELLDDGTGI
ncbi:MAG: hypothetical protein ABI243_05845, partial [Lapillicoccus sp.]